MADTKISGAPAVVTPAATDKYATAQGALSKHTTRLQMQTLVGAEQFTGDNAVGAVLTNETPSGANPSIVVNKTLMSTGIGQGAGDRSLSLILGSREGLRLTASLFGDILFQVESEVGIVATPGGGQVPAFPLQNTYSQIGTVATSGDSVKLPGSGATPVAAEQGTHIFLKNDGANACDVFPPVGDTIIPLAVDTAFSLPAGQGALFISTASNSTWTVLLKEGAAVAEVNDLSAAVTWANIPDANVPASAVTQHQAALSIAETQIPDGAILARVGAAETITGGWDFNSQVKILGGNTLRIQDPTNLDRAEFHADGVNFTLTLTNLADMIILGCAEFKVANYKFNVDQALGAGQDGFVLTYDNASGQITAKVLPAGGGLPEFQFFADQLQNPITADWAVNALAPAAADSNNDGLTVRLFDDTVEEGVGFIAEVPAGATNIVFDFVSRAETTPGAARTVGLDIYNRGIPNNAAVQAWSTATQLTDLDIPTNEFFQEDSQSVALATLGITAGETTQLELVRTTPTGGTDLTGDWGLLLVKVSFT